MKTLLISLAVAGIILATFGLMNLIFWLLNQPSDCSVTAGILTSGLLVGCYVIIGRYLYRKYQERRIKKGQMTKITNLPTILLLAVLFPILSACTRVGPGHVGIKINYAGTYRGVEDVPIKTGWVWYNPLSQQVFEYPTFVQTAVWTHNKDEGSPLNEEVSFNTKEGLIVTGDISLSYSLIRDLVPMFYIKFRSDDLGLFTHGYLRNVARDQFNEVAGRYSVEEIYGPKKEQFLREVIERLNKLMGDVGVYLEQFGFIGAPRPPKIVIDAINAKITATQLAMQSENELRRTEAEAKKVIAKAYGEAESNRILSQSINQQLIAWRQLQITEQAIAKWNGQRPMVEGGESGLLLQIPMPQAAKQEAKK
ncbi:MAG: Band 7 protein [Parcubacteria group bacterium GW2011_GWA2_42_18]|nr:MAG: Band 7 protein [Parcubacteria group bacterium GW2011_GWA2_42_18]